MTADRNYKKIIIALEKLNSEKITKLKAIEKDYINTVEKICSESYSRESCIGRATTALVYNVQAVSDDYIDSWWQLFGECNRKINDNVLRMDILQIARSYKNSFEDIKINVLEKRKEYF